MTALGGLITALVTNFDVDGRLDCNALRAGTRFQVEQGVDGLCPLGGTGEPLSLSLDEHKRVMDTVLDETAGKVPVVVGTLLSRQSDIIECGKHARAAGADAIMVAPPGFYGVTQAALLRHFHEIADQVDLPLVLFHSPPRTGVKLTANELLALLESTERFVGIKESSNDISVLAELIARAPARVRVLQGYEEGYLACLALGGHGAILSLGCLVPAYLKALLRAHETGDQGNAQAMQGALLPLCHAVYAEPNPGPLKFALDLIGRPAGGTRPPLYPPSAEIQASLRQLLSRIKDLQRMDNQEISGTP